ncbi:MAG: hypothetical protein IJP29_05470 [Lachnospiraceae bacterium]|nr:hypothetical protein [Lachnospiraceae bacterium]
MEKKQFGKWLLLASVVFVIVVAVELIAVRAVDKKMEQESMGLNLAGRKLEDTEQDDAQESYSEILGRELTEVELRRQEELQLQFGLLIYNNNIGLAQDFVLADGTWFLDEDKMCIRISSVGGDEQSSTFFTLDNQEILNQYRGYWEDSYYSYDKNATEMVERYRYYQLVFDRFYLDDMQVIPQQVSIYKVECNPEGDVDYPEVTDFALMEIIQLEVPDTEGLDCYELAEEINADTVEGLSYDYTCNGSDAYKIMRDCTLNGKFFSVEGRKKMLQDCLDENYDFVDRDLIGFSNYYCKTSVHDHELLGDSVTAVSCEQNLLYHLYRYIWQLVVFVLTIDLVVAVAITLIVFFINKNKRK